MSIEYGLHIPPDPNITHYGTGHRVQRTTINESFIMVEDPMLGDFVVGERKNDGVYYDYLTTPNMFRADSVSQLCKGVESATIPNTASFSRGWHIRGLFQIVDRLSDKVSATEVERLAYHLAADGDDQSHLAFSHAMEQAIQEWGGSENYHEKIWPKIAELGGTTEALAKHGVSTDSDIKIPGIVIPPWLNSEHPDLNADRLQYAVTELLLWLDHDGSPPETRELIRTLCSLDNFEIVDGELVFKDLNMARLFAKGYLLLATEHWNDPINRVQLHLLIHASQRVITKRRIGWMSEVDKNETRRPENYLMGIDQDIIDGLETGPGKADDFTYAIRNALYPIAMQERQRYIDYKMAEYAAFLTDEKARDYPSEYLNPKRVEFGPPSSQVAVNIKRAPGSTQLRKLPTLDMDKDGITYELGPLKNRYVDPLVKNGFEVKRLSELDPNYKKLLVQQQKIQRMSITVSLAFAGGFEEAFKKGVRLNDREFSRIKQRSPMTSDQQRRVIETAAERARAINIRLGSLVIKPIQ